MEQANGYKPIPPFTNPLAKEVGTKTHKDMRKLAPVLLMSLNRKQILGATNYAQFQTVVVEKHLRLY
jgi:hypothetical protein